MRVSRLLPPTKVPFSRYFTVHPAAMKLKSSEGAETNNLSKTGCTDSVRTLSAFPLHIQILTADMYIELYFWQKSTYEGNIWCFDIPTKWCPWLSLLHRTYRPHKQLQFSVIDGKRETRQHFIDTDYTRVFFYIYNLKAFKQQKVIFRSMFRSLQHKAEEKSAKATE